MNRADLRRLAQARVQDAQVLFVRRRYSGAYYLAGYAVECGLKACIAKNTKKGQFPDLRTVRESYTHNLNQLVGAAGLRILLNDEIKRSPNFSANWSLVITWKEDTRYEFWSRAEARDMLTAITDPQTGVLEWVARHW